MPMDLALALSLGASLCDTARASESLCCLQSRCVHSRIISLQGRLFECSFRRFAWACAGCFHSWFSGLASGGDRCHSGIARHGITGGAADLADAGRDRAMRPAFGATLPAAMARGISRPGMDCVRRAGARDDCGVPLRGAVWPAGDCGSTRRRSAYRSGSRPGCWFRDGRFGERLIDIL